MFDAVVLSAQLHLVMNDLSAPQTLLACDAKEVLREIAHEHGIRRCKSIIHRAWETGDYSENDLDEYAGILQRIRNAFGPTWLANVKL